jgi:transcriptional regulator with XRE-family HTH domain
MAPSPSNGSAKTGSEALARLIRDRREQLGMSRQELADATGVPYPTIAQIETAYRGVSPSRLGVIARTLGLDPAVLYDALASDTGTSAPATKSARRSRGAGRASNDREWLTNPSYAPSAPLLAESAPLAMEAASPSTDVVERVVALLSELPAEERLDALGRVQSRLLSGLVQDEVRRATRGPRGR